MNKKRILVIDDEEDLRDIVEFQFSAKGYDVFTAEDGIEGLEKMKTVNPDLIILDLNMPKMGGIEFYQKICTQNGRPSHPVLILTARANTKQLFLEFEVDGFITKPFDVNELVKEAEIILRKNDLMQAGRAAMEIRESKTIFIADHIFDNVTKLSSHLLSGGYKLNSASSGTKAIEKMMLDVPDLALINLGLTDIPGDIVVERLLRMSKTASIKFILYFNRKEHLNAIMEGMAKKQGVLACCEFNHVDELVKVVDDVLMQRSKAEKGL